MDNKVWGDEDGTKDEWKSLGIGRRGRRLLVVAVRVAAGGVTATGTADADADTERKGPLAKKSRFKTFWAELGPEGEASVMVESVWAMFGNWYRTECTSQEKLERYRSMGEESAGVSSGTGVGVIGWCRADETGRTG
jgi:hypothetical protein